MASAVASGRVQRQRRASLRYVAPSLAFFAALVAYPLARVAWLAFHHANLVNPLVHGFAGISNFAEVVQSSTFWTVSWNTVVWTALSVAGEYLVGLVSAVALNQPIRGRSVFRALILVPWIIPIVVAGMDWRWMLTPSYGIINVWLVRLGILHHSVDFLGQMNTSLLTVTFVNVWRSFPFYTISLLAALQTVPRELHEAAAMDGAGAIRRFWVITFPHLRPVSLTLIGLHIIWTAINFDFIWIMTRGGPLDSSETLPVLIFRYSMEQFNVGKASALACMMMSAMVTLFFLYKYGVLRLANWSATT